MALQKAVPQYRVMVDAFPPKQISLEDVRISQKIFELVPEYTIDGNTLIFEAIPDINVLTKLVKILESSGLAKFKKRPVYRVMQLAYSGGKARMEKFDVMRWENIVGKKLLKDLSHLMSMNKRSARRHGSDRLGWNNAPDFGVTICYPGHLYFSNDNTDERLTKLMKAEETGSGFGGDRDISFAFKNKAQIMEAMKRVKTNFKHRVKVYIERNIYDGRGIWDDSEGIANNVTIDKALTALAKSA